MTRRAQILHHAKVRETAITPLPIPMRRPGMSDNCEKDLPSEGLKARANRKCHVFSAWTAETRSTIKVLFDSYFISNPESESESESESEQPHHDSAPLKSEVCLLGCDAGPWDFPKIFNDI